MGVMVVTKPFSDKFSKVVVVEVIFSDSIQGDSFCG